MRAFLCSFVDFSLAIPMRSVSSIALSSNAVARYYQENETNYVSLPQLLNLPSQDIRHSIALKSADYDSNDGEKKIILFTTAIERECEIPDEKIFPLPKLFRGMRFSRLFSGINLNSSPCLLLNSQQLMQGIFGASVKTGEKGS